jgi:stage V sporulation protein AC
VHIMDPRRYRQLVNEKMPKPKIIQGITRAFLVGGTICVIGQAIYDFFRVLQPTQGEAVAATLATMIFFGALFTALGWYDKLGEYAGAGAAVPISGFSNSMVSAAIDFRREGLVLGLACNLFKIAGPVIVFATITGLVAGIFKAAFLGLFA